MKKGNPIALLPLVVFLALFLGSGIYFNAKGVDFAFYQLPAPVAAVVGVIVAFMIGKGSMNEKMDTFVSGVAKAISS